MADEGKMTDEEKFKFIKEFEERQKKAVRMINTGELGLELAYATALDANLKGEDGLIDYELLDKADKKNLVADKTLESLVNTAKQIWPGADISDAFGKEFAFNGIFGLTTDDVRQKVYANGSKLTLGAFRENVTQNALNVLKQTALSAVSSGLKTEHIPLIAEYTKAPVDPSKMTLQDALRVLGTYNQHKPIEWQEELKGVPYLIEPKAA